jgi:hypothetical protein
MKMGSLQLLLKGTLYGAGVYKKLTGKNVEFEFPVQETA